MSVSSSIMRVVALESIFTKVHYHVLCLDQPWQVALVVCCHALRYIVGVQGDKVKKGQVVAYIEQLGTFVPVEVCCTALSCAQPLFALFFTFTFC